jgi:hypothetical protein
MIQVVVKVHQMERSNRTDRGVAQYNHVPPKRYYLSRLKEPLEFGAVLKELWDWNALPPLGPDYCYFVGVVGYEGCGDYQVQMFYDRIPELSDRQMLEMVRVMR